MNKPKTEKDRYPQNFFESPKGHIKDRIRIHESIDIPVEGQIMGLNGYMFLAKPGVDIDIPRPVREMLDTRIVTVTTTDRDGKEYTKDIKRVNYTLIEEDVDRLKEAAEA